MQLGLAKHPSKLVRELRQKYRRLGAHLHLQLHHSLRLDLYLYLNLNLDSVLHHALLAKFLPQLLETFLGSKLGSILANKLRWLHDLKHSDLLRPKLPGRRPVGRPLHGRIVAENDPTTTYGQSYITVGACALRARATGGFYNVV